MLYKVKHVCPRNMDNALIMYDLYSMWNAVRDKNAIFLNVLYQHSFKKTSKPIKWINVYIGTFHG